VNETLVENPGLINSDPYVAGWIFEIAVDDAASGANLLDALAYRQLIEG
jgi:glycine cleavage system H protein